MTTSLSMSGASPRLASWVVGLSGPGTDAWAIHYAAVERRQAGRDVILLSVGDPDFKSPAPVIAAAKASLDAGRTHYAEVVGQASLRAAIAAHESRLQRRAIGAQEVVVLAGAQCALFASLLCVLDSGDEIIVPEPMYVTYPATVAAAGGRLVSVPVDEQSGFRPDLDAIARAIGPRTRAILVNTPANPTGVIWAEAELAAVAGLARAHDLWVLSDEVYATLVYEGAHVSPAGLPGMAERTVTISSLSKSHAMTGWRLGWLVGPERLAQAAGDLALAMLYGSPPFVQDAATTALTADQAEVVAMRDAYCRRRDLVCEHLANLPGITPRHPAGGMFVMLDVRGTGLSGDAFARALLEAEDVSVLSGDAFGAPAAGHVRVGLVVPEPRLTEACTRIARFARAQAMS